MSEIYVNVVKNIPTPGFKKRLKIDPKKNFQTILTEAGEKLGVEARILYSSDGAQIEDTGDLKDGETVYVSQGEKFCMAASPQPPKLLQKIIKIGVIGGPSVGKSALTVRFTQKVFIDEYIPTFEDMFKKKIKINDEFVNMDILDTSGLDELVVMRPNWYKASEGMIMVYAINNRSTFESLENLHDQVLNFKGGEQPLLVIVGNKADLDGEREVTKAEGASYAKKLGAEFFETSAKLDINVNDAFEAISKKVYSRKFRSDQEAKSCSTCNIF